MSTPIQYRVGNHQPQNIYRGDQYIAVAFNPIDAAAIVRHLNMGLGECTCESYEPCHGECCGVGMCSCSATDEDIAQAEQGLGIATNGRHIGPGCICNDPPPTTTGKNTPATRPPGWACPRHGVVI